MANVADDVTGPLNAIAATTQGLAAKNQTMKDGPPPAASSPAAGTQERKPQPSPAEKKGAYEQYKKDIQNAWSRNTAPDGTIADPANLVLDVGQAIADLAINGGPDAIKAIGDILKLGKGK
jgi:hypothetical protein